MGYTKADILEKCEKSFENKNTFYTKEFVNYSGKTSDTKEYYTEIIAEFLCKNITEYRNGIGRITRQTSYKTEGHDGKFNPGSNREEEITAIKIFTQSRDVGEYPFIGKILDYQTPLKSKVGDGAGKIDLLSFDGKVMRILELKRPDSTETMLRCVLEGFTYLQTADHQKLIKDFGKNPDEVVVKASPFVFYGSEPHLEMTQDRPHLRQLMALLDSKPFYIREDNGAYTVKEV